VSFSAWPVAAPPLSIGTQKGPLSASKRDPVHYALHKAMDVSLFG
jgi:hypothetical protein